MKATGIVRNTDQLGKVVIPKEIRRAFNLNYEDALEIFIEDNMIILRKYEYKCVFCGEEEKLIYFERKCICPDCLAKIQKEI